MKSLSKHITELIQDTRLERIGDEARADVRIEKTIGDFDVLIDGEINAVIDNYMPSTYYDPEEYDIIHNEFDGYVILTMGEKHREIALNIFW